MQWDKWKGQGEKGNLMSGKGIGSVESVFFVAWSIPYCYPLDIKEACYIQCTWQVLGKTIIHVFRSHSDIDLGQFFCHEFCFVIRGLCVNLFNMGYYWSSEP